MQRTRTRDIPLPIHHRPEKNLQTLIDTAQLRSFVVVNEAGSIAAGAASLHRVPSAVSQQIQRLEGQMGGALFLRGRRGLVLTERGRKLLPLAMDMLAFNDDALTAMQGDASGARIVVGMSDAYASSFLPSILATCSQVLPGVTVELRTGFSPGLWASYERGEIDVILAQGCPAAVIAEVIHVETLRWVGNHETNTVDGEVDLVVFSEGCPDREMAIDSLVREGVGYRLRFEGHSHASVVAAVRSGLGVTPMLPNTTPSRIRAFVPGITLPRLGAIEISLACADHSEGGVPAAFAHIVRQCFRRVRESPGSHRDTL
ncbi:LysR family transcriptional regulator [Pinirhizobacter sp.]|jgi:DNA-binding transcriptional LysR family regulator|uniref:LysR family transcriptional regulator n=1 Tax=Pinirhizobacter sp. TaxID=2950432 RepID=UPI002F405287